MCLINFERPLILCAPEIVSWRGLQPDMVTVNGLYGCRLWEDTLTFMGTRSPYLGPWVAGYGSEVTSNGTGGFLGTWIHVSVSVEHPFWSIPVLCR